MNLSTAKAVITGGASGLGLATAQAVIDAGGHAVILDVNDEQGAKSADALGDNALFIHADVSNEDNVRSACEKAAGFMGGITLAVNCAGILLPARVLGREGPASVDGFSRSIQVNLIGSYILIKEAANIMQQNEPDDGGERGVIISTASVAAFEGQIGQASYSASKGGVVGMTLPVARDLSAVGIRVNTVAPGLIDTPIYGQGEGPEKFKANLGRNVLFPKRLGDGSELASMAVACITNDYMNGGTIRVDGGIRMPPK